MSYNYDAYYPRVDSYPTSINNGNSWFYYAFIGIIIVMALFLLSSTGLFHRLKKVGMTWDSDRPPTTEELGRSGWTILHSIASNYPHRPSKSQQDNMVSFLRHFASFYPCQACSQHMSNYLKVHHPATGSKQQIQQWLCQFHNSVNQRLNKDIFDCSLVGDKWGAGVSSCSGSCGLRQH